ncbi:hypothetical protein AHAS_Ahas20G0168800 [Arachis hypogaea]
MPSSSSGTPSFAWPSLALACHAWVFKWHAQVRMRACRATPSTPSGMPKCFDPQPLLWKLVLACRALMLKWHAHINVAHLSVVCHAWVFKWHAQVMF